MSAGIVASGVVAEARRASPPSHLPRRRFAAGCRSRARGTYATCYATGSRLRSFGRPARDRLLRAQSITVVSPERLPASATMSSRVRRPEPVELLRLQWTVAQPALRTRATIAVDPQRPIASCGRTRLPRPLVRPAAPNSRLRAADPADTATRFYANESALQVLLARRRATLKTWGDGSASSLESIGPRHPPSDVARHSSTMI